MDNFIASVYRQFDTGNLAPYSDLRLHEWTMDVGMQYLSTTETTDTRPWQALAREVAVQFHALATNGISYVFTDVDPINPTTGLPDADYLHDVLRNTGTMPVYTGHDTSSLSNLYSMDYNGQRINANLMFRAVHDTLGHFHSGAPFNFLGEIRAYRCHYRTFTALARKALYCETMGQLTAGRILGVFPEQRSVVLDTLATPRN